ncbi:hypothetical protein [Flavobacterium sp.]
MNNFNTKEMKDAKFLEIVLTAIFLLFFLYFSGYEIGKAYYYFNH